jgi:hypothetical protein
MVGGASDDVGSLADVSPDLLDKIGPHDIATRIGHAKR